MLIESFKVKGEVDSAIDSIIQMLKSVVDQLDKANMSQKSSMNQQINLFCSRQILLDQKKYQGLKLLRMKGYLADIKEVKVIDHLYSNSLDTSCTSFGAGIFKGENVTLKRDCGDWPRDNLGDAKQMHDIFLEMQLLVAASTCPVIEPIKVLCLDESFQTTPCIVLKSIFFRAHTFLRHKSICFLDSLRILRDGLFSYLYRLTYVLIY